MTFEEFKELAVNPTYPEKNGIYRVDIYNKMKNENQKYIKLDFEVSLRNRYLIPDFKGIEHIIKKYTRCDFQRRLYAIYVYELPFYKNLINNMYRRLWVYNNKGKIMSQSICSTLLEDISNSCSQFRGRLTEQITFKSGDIIEYFDHSLSKVYPGLVVESPLSVEQCWEIGERIKQECIKKGLKTKDTFCNYNMDDSDDKYSIITLGGHQISVNTTDVFPLSENLSADIKEKFNFNSLNKGNLKDTTQQVIERVKDYLKLKDDFSKLIELL